MTRNTCRLNMQTHLLFTPTSPQPKRRQKEASWSEGMPHNLITSKASTRREESWPSLSSQWATCHPGSSWFFWSESNSSSAQWGDPSRSAHSPLQKRGAPEKCSEFPAATRSDQKLPSPLPYYHIHTPPKFKPTLNNTLSKMPTILEPQILIWSITWWSSSVNHIAS